VLAPRNDPLAAAGLVGGGAPTDKPD
jgi:hypothetical protein